MTPHNPQERQADRTRAFGIAREIHNVPVAAIPHSHTAGGFLSLLAPGGLPFILLHGRSKYR